MSRVNLALRLSVLVTLSIVVSMIAVDWVLGLTDPTDRRPALLLFVGLALSGGLVFAMALDRMVVRPVQATIDQVRRASEDGWTRPIEPVGGPEFQELGGALEVLRSDLVAEREQLEKRVEERTEALRRAESKLAEQARLAAVGQLAAGVAHEVNNPNAVVLSRVGYLLSVADDEGLDPDVIDDLAVIEHQSRRVAKIAGSLLQFGRTSTAGRTEVPIREVLELTRELLSRRADQNGVSLVVEGAEVGLQADRDQLEQVAFNLTQNALEATTEGRVVLRTLPDGFQVEDTGAGVDEDVIARIFDPFFTTRGVGGGTGLGLSVSYGIVSEHGGAIEVDSTPGRGSTLTVRLPA